MEPAKKILNKSVQITIPLLPSAKIDCTDYIPSFEFKLLFSWGGNYFCKVDFSSIDLKDFEEMKKLLLRQFT
jgi:hypothetical protein